MAHSVHRSDLQTVTSPPLVPQADPPADAIGSPPIASSTPGPSPGTRDLTGSEGIATLTMPAQPRFTPRQFGRYQLRAILGEGGMGVVFKAFDPQLRRIVALKQIHPRILTTRADVERFRQEAQLAAQFDHRHVITILDVGEIDGTHYFTMTYAPGGMLARQLDRFRGQPYRAVELVVKLARAVHYAHSKGILHRDLKPHNVLMDEHGEPRVTDFGLACLISGDQAWSEENQRVGTPAYMSPEQACGAIGEITPRTDIWALGVILYELLAGKRPFSAPNRDGLTDRIRHADPPPLVELQPGLPPELETIVRKCLAKNSMDRFASAADLAAALESWLASEPWLSRVGRIWRRRPWRTLVASVMLASALTFGILYAAGIVRLPAGEDNAASDFRWPTAQDGVRVGNWAKNGPLTLIGAHGAPAFYWKYRVDATGRPPLRVPGRDNLRLFTANRILLELVPTPPETGYTLTAKVRHEGGHYSSCGIYFGHREIVRGNRTEHWYWTFRFAELGTDQGKAILTAYYYHEPLAQPTRLNRRLREWTIPVDATAKPPRWHDLALSVTPDEISVAFDGRPLWRKSHAELEAAVIYTPMMTPVIVKALDPPFPTAEQCPPMNGWGGIGLYLEVGEASYCNVVVSPQPKP